MDALKINLQQSFSSTQTATRTLPETLLSHLRTLQENFVLFADWFRDFLRQYISRQTIRLVTIVGAYLLLRPYINAFFARGVPKTEEGQNTGAKVNANAIRGVKAEKDATGFGSGTAPDGSKLGQKAVFVGTKGTETTTSGAEWGEGARKRQAKFVEGREKQERRKKEMEEGEEDIDPSLLLD